MAFAGGIGTYEDPYLVSTATHINDIRNHLSEHFKQINNIDLSEYSNWIPIGYNGGVIRPFTGAYDGCNFKITGLKMYQPPRTYEYNDVHLGLFSLVKTNHELKNIHLENVQITGAISVGALVTTIDKGHIINCSSSGKITVEPGGGVGGLIGQISPSDSSVRITDCSSSVNIRIKYREYVGAGDFGGLIGAISTDPYLPNATIDILRCYSTGDVTLDDTYGFFNYYTYIENIGGLIGDVVADRDYNTGNFTMINIRQCYSTGVVRGIERVGGLIGSCANAILTDCYSTSNLDESPGWSKSVYGREYMFKYFGGFIGTSSNNIITNCYSCGKVANAPYGEYTQKEYHGFAGPSEYGEESNVTASYYDVEKAGRSDNLAILKTTIEMKEQNTYAGWDFDKIWGINTTVNNGYPYLLYSYELPAYFSVYVTTDEGLKKAKKICLITNESTKDIIKISIRTEVKQQSGN